MTRDPTSTFGNFGEAQYLFRTQRFSTVAGAGYSSGGVVRPDDTTRSLHANGYVYSYLQYPYNLTWTLGVSFDSLTLDGLGDFEQANPKLGLVWQATRATTFRLAAFRTLKRTLLTNQTIEPTQVAGFNQFFDDFAAAETRRYGIAVDHKFNLRLYGGLEFSARELEIPRAGIESSDLDERSYRAYLDWTPNDRISATLAYELDDFEAAESISPLFPETTTTHLAEAGLRFFGSSGFFSHIDASYINQKAVSSDFLEPASNQNEFVVINAGLGYRLPKRFGILRLEINNLFDKDFNFQSLGNRTIEPENLQFLPERTIFAGITLAF